MNRVLVSFAAVSFAALAQSATAATVVTNISPSTVTPPAVFQVTGDPTTGTSVVTATIGNTITAGTTTNPASFTDNFLFRIGPATSTPTQIGLGSGSIITSSAIQFSATDLDFTSVFVNGIQIPIVRDALGLVESAADANVPIFSGALNTIQVNGLSRGFGSYGGNLTFTPRAVPEPATWAMMLLGFGAIGMTMRRKRKATIPQLA